MQIASITITGMHNRQTKTLYQFGKAAYITGPNGSGKSTILQAIQLALLGYIPGTNKRPADIFKHSSSGDILKVKAELKEGDQLITVERSWGQIGDKLTSGVTVTPDGYDVESICAAIELPIFNFNEFVNMTPNQLKDWFLSFLPSDDSGKTIHSLFTDKIEEEGGASDELINLLMSHISDDPVTTTSLSAANATIKQIKSLKTKELTQVQGTLATLVRYDDVDPALTLETISAEREALNNERTAFMDHERRVAAQTALETRNYNRQYEISHIEVHDDAYVDVLKSDLAFVRGRMTEVNDERYAVKDAIHVAELAKQRLEEKIKDIDQVIESGGICTYTHEVCKTIQDHIASLKEQRIEYVKELEANAESDKQKDAELYTESNKLIDRERELIKLLNEEQTHRDQVAYLKAQMETGEDIEPYTGRSLDIINAESARLDQLLVKVGANEQFNRISEKTLSQVAVLKRDIEIVKMLDTLTGPNGLQTQLARAPFEKLKSGMDAILHALLGTKVSTEFILSEKANSFSMGLKRDDRYIPYSLLSSGEKCLYAFAIMCYIINNSGSPLKLLMIDDSLDHLDDDNMTKLFKFITSNKAVNNIQFILAGAKCPTEVEPSIIMKP